MKQATVFFHFSAFAVVLCTISSTQSAEDGVTSAGTARHLEGSRPNMILIIADDVSATDLGCYGNKTTRTPNLDRLAAHGQRWTRGYLTASVCSPSRCSIITGRYPHNTGAPELHTGLPDGQPLFPRELRRAGYWCAQAGKWHLGNYPKIAFDKVITDKKTNGDSGCRGWVTLLRERPKDRPFFLWLASYDAHRPWQPDVKAEPHDPQAIYLPEPLADTSTTRNDLAAYHDEVQRLDRYVGLIVDELENQGIRRNTLVLFIADNGRPFPRAKRWITEAGSRTPWIMHWPDGLGSEAKVCEQLASVIDIAPTCLELAGADVPSAVQGRSLLPQLVDPDATVCSYVFAERNWQVEYCHERMLRHGPWAYYRNNVPELGHFGYVNATHYKFPAYVDLWKKLHADETLTAAQQSVFLKPRPREQLFRLTDDPMEIRNLTGNPKHRQVLLELRAVMDQWIDQTGDTVPPPDVRTPDRHDRMTGRRLHPGGHPGPDRYEFPGQSAGAAEINRPGPR